ncbi:cytochrome ubiquinol oxidase subunit I [Paraburkholderia kirstenboschensis]|uniref:Cytochrome ubiquinol oxidase subunit I n=1 Tax=Paraburkholderia kirstenboschensis TaxID=1245436 RepID=A0ABZ0EC10_9BURK|nr:cytochrome ubiquinol oxidase subunit I [Paraburkholderia kirstenboschensis]WOD14742.1 cytochrome ubiquinol oxidase subunit I [Paraburkholderia kirstenboschensis]
MLIAWPDEVHEKNDYAISVPVLGSLIASMTLDSKEVGLTNFPRSERPPVVIPFFTFRVMVACSLIMLLVAWGGTLLSLKERLLQRRALLWTVFLCFPGVVEDLVQRQCRRRSASATTQVWQDKLPELRLAQFRRNRLPSGLTRNSMRPEIWTLADFHLTLKNPVCAGLADKFDQLEKPATS